MAATTMSIVVTTQVVHVGSGASMAAGAVSGSADVSTALASTNLFRYPLCDVSLFIAPTASVAASAVIIPLYRRDLNHDGTNDEDVPGASNKNKRVGVFTINASTTVSTSHYQKISDVPLDGGDCEFYIENGLAVNIPAGWTLKVTPKTYAQA